MTRPDLVPGSPEWVRLATASKVPAILGLSKWETPASLWLTMAGHVPYDDSTSSVQLRGRFMEPYALHWFWKVRHPNWTQLAGEVTWTRDDLPWAAATTDSHGITDGGRLVFVEAKSVGNFAALDHWGRPDTDEVPFDYWVQVQWQMHMTHGFGGDMVTRTFVERVGPCLDDHASYVIDYDREAADRIEATCAAFVESLSDPDGCPPADQHPVTQKAFARANPEIEKDVEWEVSSELAREYLAAVEAEGAARGELSRCKAELLRVMGRAQYAVCGGVRIARRQASKGAPSLRHAGVSLADLDAASVEVAA